ncbi:dienelactone hydrolase family protein [Solitalea lacus]|uniref:dienelactone hydrolase family protein n=1 Tax=Solitalea lacus TaxID=2911172 RepID=UPI001ED9DA59|nr:dienelactone hydrolase family protein [Solitalea lacus]UKJ07342.1 dienelactone hydrolase family protein [Solitalea lacus]
MKNIVGLLLQLICIPLLGFGQTGLHCCQLDSTTNTKEFAQFSSDKEFISSHIEPLKFSYTSKIGKDLMLPTADGKDAHVYELKAAKPTNNYIFVIHEWWGLNDYIKRESEKLYKDVGNVNVIAIDLYDKQIATSSEDAAKFMQGVTEERSQTIIEAVKKHVGTKAKIATIGWCFGGGWSLKTSLILEKQAVACIMYYGMPERNVEKLKALNPDVLGIFAKQDKWITPQIVEEFEQNLKKAGKKVTIKMYDADHAFANPSNPKYNKAASEDAYATSIAFLKNRLK